jgi:hypothetical protein
MMLGGYDGDVFLNNVYEYKFTSGSWTDGPSMFKGRHWMTCGVMTCDKEKIVVVAGGKTGYSSHTDSTTELFHVATKTWSEGKIDLANSAVGVHLRYMPNKYVTPSPTLMLYSFIMKLC